MRRGRRQVVACRRRSRAPPAPSNVPCSRSGRRRCSGSSVPPARPATMPSLSNGIPMSVGSAAPARRVFLNVPVLTICARAAEVVVEVRVGLDVEHARRSRQTAPVPVRMLPVPAADDRALVPQQPVRCGSPSTLPPVRFSVTPGATRVVPGRVHRAARPARGARPGHGQLAGAADRAARSARGTPTSMFGRFMAPMPPKTWSSSNAVGPLKLVVPPPTQVVGTS